MALYCCLGMGLEWAEPQPDEWVSPCGGMTNDKGYFPLLHHPPLLVLSGAVPQPLVAGWTSVEGQMGQVDHGGRHRLQPLEV